MGCSVSAVDPSANKPAQRISVEPAAKRHRLEPSSFATKNDIVWPGKKRLIPDLAVFKEIDQRAIAAPNKLRTKPAEFVTENDLVWPGKKRLIPDLAVFKEIDQRAIAAPNKLRTKPAELVAYLIAPCKTDLEKFRVIFRWVASHIDYDVDFLNTGRPGMHRVEDCLASGKAICAGYSGVIKDLCSHAKINIVIVSGCSKGGNYHVGDKDEFKIVNGLPTHTDHAWVFVQIDEQKFLSDPTWAAGKTGLESGRKIYKRQWDESYFLSDPEAFFETHWPMSNKGESLYHLQLTKTPNTNFADWLERPHKNMAAHYLGVILLSHKKGRIETGKADVEIEFTSKYTLRTNARLEILNGNVWQTMERMTLLYHEGDKYKVRVRLPYNNAEFIFWILANLRDAEPELADRPQLIACYKMICKGKGNDKGYHPDLCGRAGIEWEASKLGFQIDSHTSPVLVTKGQELITISCPNVDPISLSFRLTRLSDNAILNGQCYLERDMNRIICHIRMYDPGEHAFILFGDLKQEGSAKLAMLGNFLLDCSAPLQNTLLPFCRHYSVNGPNKLFHSLGIRDLCGMSSIKKAEKDGRCSLRFKVPLDKDFWPVLYDHAGNKLATVHTCTYLEHDVLNIALRLPKPGNFTLRLFQRTVGNTLESLAFYMVQTDHAYQGEMFPLQHRVIGPLPLAKDEGLEPVDKDMKYYQMITKATKVLKFRAKFRIDDVFAILKSQDDKQDYIKCNFSEKGGHFMMTYDIILLKTGIYRFQIWRKGGKQLVNMLIEYT